MQVRFWGTRGSIAKAGPSTLRFGGNTSCVEILTDAGTLIVIDCGTGAHGLGQDLLARDLGQRGHLLISHTHWDHIQGLPFFAPLFIPGSSWHVYGPRGLSDSVSDILAGQMEYSYFPINLDQLGADIEYHDLVEGSFDVGEANVTTQYLNHPALAIGFRIEVDGATVVYASDHEPHHRELAGGGDFSRSPQDAEHAAFLQGADLVIHDAQYLASEYEAKKGWGHSTVEYVVDAARHAGARRLALFHHDPTRHDSAVDDAVAVAKTHAITRGYEGEVFAAAEGMTLEIHGTSARPDRIGRPAADRKPAVAQVGHSMLLCTRTSDIRAGILEAAEAEGFAVWEADDLDRATELIRRHEPAIVVFEDDANCENVPAFTGLVRGIGAPYGDDAILVAVTGSGARCESEADEEVTDWLVWPSSVVYARTKLRAWILRRACRWQPAPLPHDEEQRLASLRNLGVLDTPPEDRFDRLTKEASERLGVPIALVSLVDEARQWFKSRYGLDATETPRDMAFCAHAINEEDLLHVPDALTDPRFADNPLVAGDPRVRFYAGVPLTLSDGSRAGTMCVIDYRPRMLSDDQLEELRRLGQAVTDELEAAG